MKQSELRARCSDEELLALRLVARLEHRRPTEMLRELVRASAQRHGVWPPDPDGSTAVLTDGDNQDGE